MLIEKAEWVKHADDEKGERLQPIYSIDVHPDCTRFATGGGDNKVKIWACSQAYR